MNLESIGKFFLIIGVVFLVIGSALILAKNVPFMGRLPGDILIEKKNFTFYFPVATSILLSVILSIIMYFISRR